LKNPEKWWGKVTEKDAKLALELKKNLTASNQTSKIIDITSVAFSKERTDGKRLKSVSFYVAYYVKGSSGKMVKDTKGQAKRYTKKVTITADQFKNALGLRSKYVTSLKSITTTYQLTILGNGHGVGMSQSGAGAMAKKGKGFREILAFYYPNTELKNDRMISIPTKPLQVTGTINYEGVNIRKSPSLTGIKLGTGKLNQSVTVLGKSGEWFKIRTGTLTGYIHEEYVNIHQEITYNSGITPITSGRIQSLGAPVVREKNTLYVPAAGLTKRYGMNYKVSGSSFTIMNGKNKITASLSSNTATVNGKKISLSVRPKLIYKAVYVPASFLKETGIATYYEEKAESVLWINK
jgi:stage II sporulation protein D